MIKPIAYYLPQYHPVEENNRWWGPGFTEWTNVAKARPLYKGHEQPHIPADLGFYDLRLEETRIAQAEMAKKYGVYGFCYWHYWFGNGKRILERPFNEVLSSGKPDFPFCLAWANESWTGVWHGVPNKILIEQKYPGKQDDINHFYSILPAFLDSRYITIEQKPLFIIYRARKHPALQRFIDTWQSLAIKEGLPGIAFLYLTANPDTIIDGFEGSIIQENFLDEKQAFTLIDKISYRLFKQNINEVLRTSFNQVKRISYKKMVDSCNNAMLEPNQFPTIVPNWDNTPRSGKRGVILEGSSPEVFQQQVHKALQQIHTHPSHRQFLFVKSWNEWAEGNYLEPDLKYGHQYLQALFNEIKRFTS